MAYLELSQQSDALQAFERSLKIEPENADTHFNVAEILRVKGELDGAVESYRQALIFNSEHVEAWNNMGISLRAQGNTNAAIACYCNALQVNPEHKQSAFNLGTALTNIRFVTPDKNLAAVIAELLDKPGCLRPSTICEAVLSLVKQDEFVQKALVTSYESESSDTLKQVVSDLSKVPLLLKLMKVCPITDLEFEALFTGLRSGLLLNIASFSKDPDTLEVQVALATQCHITEYIYAETEVEEKAVGIIEQALRSKKANLSLIGMNRVACLASYRGLYQYSFAQNNHSLSSGSY